MPYFDASLESCAISKLHNLCCDLTFLYNIIGAELSAIFFIVQIAVVELFVFFLLALYLHIIFFLKCAISLNEIQIF